jgi:Rrf2 family protein
MKISTKGHYGLRFILDLAAQGSTEFISTSDIAKRQDISEKYLWQVVAPLKARGFLQIARGVMGGYRLARPASGITVRELVEALEGKIAFAEPTRSDSQTKDPTRRVARELWNSLASDLVASMNAVTLQDLVDKQKALKGSPLDYVI